MKLLLIPHYFAPIGGPRAIRWTNIARFLAEAGHHTTVIAAEYPPDSPIMDDSLLAIGEHANLAVHRIAVRDSSGGIVSGIRWARQAARVARQLCPRPDALISSAMPIASHFAAHMAQRRGGAPVWIADYGDPWSVSKMRPVPALRRAAELAVERHILRRASAVTLTTPASVPLFRELYAGRIEIIPQGASLFHLRGDWSARTRAATEPVMFLYPGGFYRGAREPSDLFDALARVAGIRFAIVGFHQLDIRPFVKSDNVELREYASLQRIVEMQRAADVLVVMSFKHSDQIPGKVYEYLATRRPILYVTSSPDDEVARLLRHNGCGVVCGFGAEAIAAGLTEARDLVQSGRLVERAPVAGVGFDERAARFVQLIEELRK
jgi:glycosyltransferase involved in cell wall biosynthesis